jgi:hypothetical protein
MKIRTIANILLVMVLATAMTACGSSKKVALGGSDEELVNDYCTGGEYQSSSTAFRYTAVGESMDQMMSKKKAMSEARAGLAAEINTKVKAVTDNYGKDAKINNKEEFMARFETMSREVVNQTLSGVIVKCEKTTKSKSTGNYKTYVCLELGSNEMLQSINNRMTADEQLKVDYNYEKYKKTFEEEMSKLGQ